MGVGTGRFAIVRPVDVGWVERVSVSPVLLVVAVLLGYAGAKVLVRSTGAPTDARAGTRQ